MTGSPDPGRRPQVDFRPPASAPGGALGRWSQGFEKEWTALLSRRLRLLVAVLWSVGLFAYVANVATEFAVHGLREGWPVAETPLLLGVLVGLGLHVLLARANLPRRGLEAVDALLLTLLYVVFAAEYHLDFRGGGGRAVAFIALWTVVRAVVVPSRAGRTAGLSALGPLLVFLLAVLHGRSGDPVPAKYPDWASIPPFSGRWWSSVVWDQIFLAIAVGTAALASSVNFRLRLRAYEARRIDRYVLEAPLGQGAMGEIYRARHPMLPRPVAVKLLRADAVGDEVLSRFEEEVRQTSRLSHPNNVVVYDVGKTAEGTFYYAMELLHGADLQRLVEATGPMSPARTIHVLAQACEGLHEAHERGLIHRDVKPGNLILCERGLVHDVLKVTDYGLVKDLASRRISQTGMGEVVGTPETLAPEILQGETPSPAADVYGLAAVGVFLLTGKPIFDVRTVAEFLASHLTAQPVRPTARDATIPADLEAVLLRGLEKDPARRPRTARALREELLRCADAGRWTAQDAAAWWAARPSLLPPVDGAGVTAGGGAGEVAAARGSGG